MKKIEPILIAHLLPRLDELLIEFLGNLSPSDWNRQSLAPLWKVKDVAAHLLDGNIRSLSMIRDSYDGEKSENPDSYLDLVAYLNRLNADWVKAFRRVSPAMLIALLKVTGPIYCRHMQSLDPNAPAKFAVNWAGETRSKNWFHVAREYTEKWHHQQQIRFAVNDDQVLLGDDLYLPFLATAVRALPHHYRNISADEGCSIRVSVTGVSGALWHLVRGSESWELCSEFEGTIASAIKIDKATAWRIFSRGIAKVEARERVVIEGDQQLGLRILDVGAVMV